MEAARETLNGGNSIDRTGHSWLRAHAQGCAAVFGDAMARLFPDHSMPAYKRALNAQAAKASHGTIAEARAAL